MTKDVFQYATLHASPPQGRRLWLYGDAGYATSDAYTPYHGEYVALQKKGIKAVSDTMALSGRYDCVYVACPKQREEARGLIALALLRSSGFVMAVAANEAGGNRLAKLLAEYGIETRSLSKHHCKIVFTRHADKADSALIERNLALLAPRKVMIESRQWWSLPGLFSWDAIDAGSKLLAAHLPENLVGVAADFGCGFGYLSVHLAGHSAAITSIDAYDNDARAVAMTLKNAGTRIKPVWQDMRLYEPNPVYDVAVMNPPFHSGKEQDVGLGELFIRKAWASLKKGGRLFMVANRNLPYEETVPQLKIAAEADGYKIMTGQKI